MTVKSPDPLNEMKILLSRMCDEQITNAEQERLRDLIRDHSECVHYYIDYMQIHGMLYHEATVDVCLGKPTYQSQFERTLKSMKRRLALKQALLTLSVASFMLLCLCSIIWFNFGPKYDPVARIEKQSELVSASDLWTQEQWIKRNTNYVLKEGIISLAFDRGSEITIKGPAEFIPRGPLMIELISGELSAYIPHPDAQFRVRTAEFDVVDLGTAFTVDVSEAETDVHVMSGKVFLAPAQSRNIPMTELTHGESVRVERTSMKQARSTATPDWFDTWKFQLQSINLPSSGQFLEVGQQDKRWRISELSSGRQFQAFVRGNFSSNIKNQISQGQWISIPPVYDESGKMNYSASNLPHNESYIFSTEIDLEAMDLQTVRLFAKLAADNSVTEIRLNGQTVAQFPFGEIAYQRMKTVTISSGFQDGLNLLEFVVFNGILDSDGNSVGPATATPIAFRADLSGFAHPKNITNPRLQE